MLNGNAKPAWGGCVVVGLLLLGVFVAVILAYVVTEHLLTLLDVRRRVLVGDGWPLMALVGANGTSFLVVWVSSLLFIFAAQADHYYDATIVCLCIQGAWLSQHLWFYHRDHLRLRYE